MRVSGLGDVQGGTPGGSYIYRSLECGWRRRRMAGGNPCCWVQVFVRIKGASFH